MIMENNENLENPTPVKKKPCYFWRLYKYYVDANQITLKGWIDWCNELYEIQHGKKRTGKIFVNPVMRKAMVKGHSWNKDRIEAWLTNHGYSWTMEEEIHYQFPFNNLDEVELIDSDARIRQGA